MCPNADNNAAPTPPIPPGLALHDAHCHPTDTPSSLAQIPQMRASSLILMSTRSQDQSLVHETAAKLNGQDQNLAKVIPAFGWHPWFSHQLYHDAAEQPTYNPDDPTSKAAHYAAVLTPDPSSDTAFVGSLPTPKALTTYLAETRERLLAHPKALVGEVGVDKAFRLPDPCPSEGRRFSLSPYRVRMSHQATVLVAQLRLAAELDRAVSVHSVQAPAALFDTLASLWKGHEKEVIGNRKRRMVAEGAEDFSESEDEDSWESDGNGGRRKKAKPFPPRICLHSFGGNLQTLKEYLNPAIPASIFVSFSSAINFAAGSAAAGTKYSEKINLVREVPENRLLLETDLHRAGEDMDRALEDIYALVCRIRGWEISEGARIIGRNFDEFISG